VLLGVGCIAGCGDDDGSGGSGGETTSTSTTTSTTTTGSTGGGGSGIGGDGGNGQGGDGTGGDGGDGQGGDGTGGNAGAAQAECTEDADCYVNNDCCECAGRPNGQAAPACNIECLIDTCNSIGLGGNPMPSCQAGRCVTAASCDAAPVTCDAPVPACAPGQSPIVIGNCYNGSCLDSLECASVTSCTDCDGLIDATCVVNSAFTQSFHCATVADPCGSASCACLGPSVCVEPFTACNEVAGHIECGCPTCL
jgi:hypothetical protein